jgi:hypothetical protein
MNSDWKEINMGGKLSYFNLKTGITVYEKPGTKKAGDAQPEETLPPKKEEGVSLLSTALHEHHQFTKNT